VCWESSVNGFKEANTEAYLEDQNKEVQTIRYLKKNGNNLEKLREMRKEVDKGQYPTACGN
jgi:hypothetical protein